MAYIDFGPSLSWYDLHPHQVQGIARREERARNTVREIALGNLAVEGSPLQKLESAQETLISYEIIAEKFLRRVAARRNLQPEAMITTLEVEPADELKIRLPGYYSPDNENQNWAKGLREASGYKGASGKKLTLREVAAGTGLSIAAISYTENDKYDGYRFSRPRILDYYADLHELKDDARDLFYEQHEDLVGDK
jgi:hypothetical protein